jgi:cyanophycinase
VLHVLPATSTFDLKARALLSYGPQPPAEELAELQAAEADLRALADEIAAEGVSPAYYAERKRRAAGRRTTPTKAGAKLPASSSAGTTDSEPRPDSGTV